ncbi:MAG: hypothetical protein J2P41_24065, partial [Blastocatellia bacterium]|nr:hypothetical protein [Blastocatellia bacterium]
VAPVAPVAPVVSEAELTNLEMKALMMLHSIDADLGEEVSLTHSKDGRLQIEAIVDTLQRKNRILASLAPIMGRPAVIIRIETVAEALRVQKKKTSIQPSVQEYDATAGAIPAEPELRAYFSNRLAKPANEEIDTEIRKFAIDILNRSQRSLLFAYALKRLAGRFSNNDLQKLDVESRVAWYSMVATHAQKLSAQTAEIRKEVQPVFAPASGGEAPSVDSPRKFKNEADLLAAVKQLSELEIILDRDLRSAFIAGSQTEPAQSVKTVKLLRDLLKVEKLSAEIYKSAIQQ